MQFDDAETENLKQWVTRKLENNSDADPDVLADYVLALVKTEGPDDQVLLACAENLQDFLGDGAESFVKDLGDVIRDRSYIPGHVPQPTKTKTQTAPVAPTPPAGPAADNIARNNHQNNARPGSQSRKRSYHNRDHSDANSQPQFQAGERVKKQMRRSGPHERGGRHQHQPFGHQGNVPPGMQIPAQPQMPAMPPGFPPLDPNNPMAAVMAMQAMGFPGMPAFPAFPNAPSPQGQSSSPVGFGLQGGDAGGAMQGQTPPKSGRRCPDYDSKGFCAAGASCPHDHGEDPFVVPGSSAEYNPRSASVGAETSQRAPKRNHHHKDDSKPAHRGGRGGFRGGRGGGQQRASFSSTAPNFDRNVTSLVVENIPEEKFAADDVQNFFSEFGAIEEVSMQPYKRLAIVKFKDWTSAKTAYDSPKVVFDNRFVKVYWYKPDRADKHGQHAQASNAAAQQQKQEDEEMVMDPEEVEKRQAEAQKAYEEKQKKQQEAAAEREEIDRRIKAQAEERRQLLEKLAAKRGASASSASPAPNGTSSSDPTAPDASTAAGSTDPATEQGKQDQTELLRAKLAALESQAETLGIPSEDAAPSHHHPYSNYRGRGRGRGYNAYNPYFSRGGYPPRGRGAPFRGSGVGGVARLDNRPKSVKVTAPEAEVTFTDSKATEALNAHLLNVGDYAAVTAPASPDEPRTALVQFHERYVAEMFVARGYVEGLGKVEFAWVPNAPPAPPAAAAPAVASPPASSAATGQAKAVGPAIPLMDAVNGSGAAVVPAAADDAASTSASRGEAPQQQRTKGEMDWDVADEREEDEDRWMR